MIKRYLSDNNLLRMEHDFKFLLKSIQGYNGELDLFLRDNYFNLYYKGNSLAKVSFKSSDQYLVSIHNKFFSGGKAYKDSRFSSYYISRSGQQNYQDLLLPAKLLPQFFQKNYLNGFFSLIRKENYGEELTMEQQLINDNRGREDLIIIDRQVAFPGWKRRIDLLGLQKTGDAQYQFLIIEVKLGNNPELYEKVGHQIVDYIKHINDHFVDYKACYEKNYIQNRQLGLISSPKGLPDIIDITNDVKGQLVVVGYTGLAQKSLESLYKAFPNLSNHQPFKVQTLPLTIL